MTLPLRLCSALAALALAASAQASDHLDTPRVVADPRADIGDIYAWTSPDGRRLNLVMAIVGHGFSEKLAYTFHIDSGRAFNRTTASIDLTCRFTGGEPRCRLGGRKAELQVFAGLRDDPFFNNVKGTREAYNFAAAALAKGVARDEAGCPAFDAATSAGILDLWRHTTGGPAQNLLAGWTPASLVISVDVAAVSKGGPVLAVWADTHDDHQRIDRMGRPLTGNALLATLGAEDEANALKEQYNRATPATSDPFVPEIEKALGLYDGFDGRCGDSLLADPAAGASRYLNLAILLADDRLWIDSRAPACATLFAVERGIAGDCGGRAPSYDAMDAYRSLLVNGTLAGVSDGVDRDDRIHSDTVFPFLAPPPATAWLKDR